VDHGHPTSRKIASGVALATFPATLKNNLPPGVVYRPGGSGRRVGKYPDVGMIFTPKPCMHCDNPPCGSGLPGEGHLEAGRRCRCCRLQHLHRLPQLSAGMPPTAQDCGFLVNFSE